MIAVVIPSYKCKKHILNVITTIGSEVNKIYIVDDCCPEKTGAFVLENNKDPRVKVLFNEINLGVGGAVMNGYRQALLDNFQVVVKVDGDGQMDPELIPLFIRPILLGEADYTKGNRFYQIDDLRQMPKLRVFGNTVLSFLSKLSSGYWRVFDPTNGYTAIHTSVLQSIDLDKVSKRYFFESDFLFRLNISGAVVVDVPMIAKYGDEKSNLSEFKIIPSFLKGHFRNFLKRIFYNYFLRDFNIASLELLLGTPLLFFGLFYGLFQWCVHSLNNTQAPNGTVMLAALSIILGFQMLLGFFNFDMNARTEKPLHKKLSKN